MKLLFVLSLIPFLTFCTSVEEQAFCQKTNWKSQGKHDAYEGKTIDQYISYHDNCKYYEYPMDKQGYYDGYADGLMTFCTPERATSFGLSGGKYQNQCPAHLEVAFIPAYTKAYESFLKNKNSKSKDDD